jgi:hypothetical protein
MGELSKKMDEMKSESGIIKEIAQKGTGNSEAVHRALLQDGDDPFDDNRIGKLSIRSTINAIYKAAYNR